jgi:phage terminase large subunit-like protein
MLEINKQKLQELPEELRAEALEVLERLGELGETKPITLYFPHPKQRYFHMMRHGFKAFFGGNQSGKTIGGLADDLIQALPRSALPKHLLKYKYYEPPFLCRIFTTDLITLQLVTLEKLKGLTPADELEGGSWEKAYDKQLRTLRFKCGSVFQFMTYEQDTKRMGGASINRVHYDEEPPLSVRNENLMRVMAQGGDELITMTPLEGFTWTYEDIYEYCEKNGKEVAEGVYAAQDKAMVMVDIEDNPAISKKNREKTLAEYAPDERKARKTGRFIPLEGIIYKQFDPMIHVIDQDEIDPNWNIVVGIDPGHRNECGVVWCGLDASDNMTIFDEFKESYTLIKDVCDFIHSMNAAMGINPIYYVIDPHARNRNQQTGRSDQMEFADYGINPILGQDDVKTGIDVIKTRLHEQRLHIYDNCVNIQREFKKYRWKPISRTDDDGKPIPVKKDDHLLDALRYVAMSRPYLPKKEKEDENLTYLQRMMRNDQISAGKRRNKSEFGGIFN